MSYRAAYTYAWDLAERGLDTVVAELRGLGLNTATLAGAYHAGKFLRPRGMGGKVYFPEDGTVYFRTDAAAFGRIKPQAWSGLAEHDFFAELSARSDIAVNAWMVLLHNTRVGLAYPDATVENAFGDRFIYSLCPSNPDARAYAVALCREVTARYGVTGLSIETPGFLPYVHGYHHEFGLMRQNRWFDNSLGLCFCPHCLKGASAAGIDAAGLRGRVKADIESFLAAPFDIPDDMAEAFWLADTRTDGELAAFLAWRTTVVTSLVAEIRATVRKDAAVAIIPSVARPTAGAWYEGSDLKALHGAAGIIEACFYEPGADRVAVDAWDIKRRIGGAAGLRGILRPGFPDLRSKGEVIAAVGALAAAGIRDIAFYNYGHLRQASLDWFGEAMATLGD
ncbi:MAG TPA: hypothetical protein PKA74_13285 [Bauldia sp.]|nr:hypothetical protein [Bauldia sp.]